MSLSDLIQSEIESEKDVNNRELYSLYLGNLILELDDSNFRDGISLIILKLFSYIERFENLKKINLDYKNELFLDKCQKLYGSKPSVTIRQSILNRLYSEKSMYK